MNSIIYYDYFMTEKKKGVISVAKFDRSTRIFHKYARLGFDKRRFSSIEIASRAYGCCGSEKEALRLIAVYDMLRMLNAFGKKDCADALRAVYFENRGRPPRLNDISFAVRRFAEKNRIDDRTVWRRINEAKKLYSMLLKGQNICS